jgi:hypothetical protein
MHVSLKKRTPGQIEFGIIYGGIALVALFVVRFFPVMTALAPSCVFKGLTGIPCPTCGGTRAAVHLASGDVIASLGMNPLAATVLIFGILCFFYSALTFLFNIQRINLVITDHEKNAARLILIATAAINWTYLIFTL